MTSLRRGPTPYYHQISSILREQIANGEFHPGDRVPSALPYIFAGLEMGVVYSFIGAVVGEFVGGTRGLGVQLLQMNAAMDVSGMFAVLILLAAMGAASSKLLQLIRSRVLYWAPSEQKRKM